MKIALSSLNQAWKDKEKNMEECALICSKAAGSGADLVVFPEMTLTGYVVDDFLGLEESPERSPTFDHFSSLAKTNSINILFGYIAKDHNIYNRAVVVDREGEQILTYDKNHLFELAGEDRHFTPGETTAQADIEGVTLGVSICYDLRFPDLYADQAETCQLLINIANWPKERVSDWRKLLSERAKQNDCYVVGVNRTGIDGNDLEYQRSSEAYNSDGAQVAGVRICENLDLVDLSTI